MVAILTSVIAFGAFSVIQSFGEFNSVNALSKINQDNLTVVEKDTEFYPYGITDDFSFVKAEKTYALYDQTIWLENANNNSLDLGKRLSDRVNFSELYIHENYGLFTCDREYLTKLYGKDGKITLLAGSLDGAEQDTGVYITDYFADSILYHETTSKLFRFFSYEDLIGVIAPSNGNTSCKIAGIIDTDYEVKYQSVFELYNEHKEDTYEERNLEKILSENPVYMEFMEDVLLRLGVGYTLNPNFIDDFSLEETSLVRSSGLYLCANEKEIRVDDVTYMTTMTYPVACSEYADDEIAIPYKYYNVLFGTRYTEMDSNALGVIDKKVITVKRYVDDDNTKPLIHEREFTVVAVNNKRISCSENTMLYFKKADWKPSRLYFEGVENPEELMAFMQENGYHYVSIQQQNLQKLNNLVVAFYDLFAFLQIIIICMLVVYLINFGARGVKQNSYQIGVIKALGGRSRDVENIFVLRTLVIGAMIAVVSVLASIGFINIADSILLKSVESVVRMKFASLTIIEVLPSLLIIDGLSMLGIAVLSALVPALTLRKIKPIKTIKAKE